MKRWHAALLGFLVAAGVAAYALRHRARARSVGALLSASGPLAPDPRVVHYRFTTGAAESGELDEIITGLEKRRTDGIASPFDLGDLAEAYFQRAQRSGDAQDFTRSEAMAKLSLDGLAAPNGASLVLARIANARHEFRDAIRIASEYASRKPSAGAENILASSYLALGELDLARAAADRAVELEPRRSGYLMQALVLDARGEDLPAAQAFAKAVSREQPDEPQESARTRALWARFLIRRGDLTGAKLVADEALRIVPEYPLALAQEAEIALRSGRVREARDLFERAFVASRQVRYLIDKARAQELAGDRVGATSSRQVAETLIRGELGENSTGHKLDLVEVLTDRGMIADLIVAVWLGREELTHRPSNETRFQLARALARTGQRDEALALVRTSIATGVRDARLFELAARLEHGPDQKRYAAEAARLDPGASGWRTLGMP